MTRYLLGTNVVSELRKIKPHGAVVAWLETLAVEQILISAVTMGELQTGVEVTRKQDPIKAQQIESWLATIEGSFAFVAMDSACFREWSRLMAGKPDSLREDAMIAATMIAATMIAATARLHGLKVATRDEKDFKHLGVEIINPFKFQ